MHAQCYDAPIRSSGGISFGGMGLRTIVASSTLAWAFLITRAVWSADKPTPPPTAGSSPRLLREGDKITDQEGHFKATGNRLTFVMADGNQRFVVLENLNLERVARVVGEHPQTIDWTVSGTITEYQGNNYLLVSHAARKTRLNERRPTP